MLLDDMLMGVDLLSGGEWGTGGVWWIDRDCNKCCIVDFDFIGDCDFSGTFMESDSAGECRGMCNFNGISGATDSTGEANFTRKGDFTRDDFSWESDCVRECDLTAECVKDNFTDTDDARDDTDWSRLENSSNPGLCLSEVTVECTNEGDLEPEGENSEPEADTGDLRGSDCTGVAEGTEELYDFKCVPQTHLTVNKGFSTNCNE